MSLEQNYKKIQSEIKALGGKDWLAVSKKHASEKIRKIYSLGHRKFGENYVQELLEKVDDLKDLEIEWHYIGGLQTNKVGKIVGKVELIHSVDREKLLNAIDRVAGEKGLSQKILLQLSFSQKEGRWGAGQDEILSLAKAAKDKKHVKVCGLMCIPPQEGDTRDYFIACREQFECLKTLFSKDYRVLSMGMSADYQLAIEEGSTLPRIGSTLFGPRAS